MKKLLVILGCTFLVCNAQAAEFWAQPNGNGGYTLLDSNGKVHTANTTQQIIDG